MSMFMNIGIIVIALFLIMIGSFVSPTFAQKFAEPHYEIRGGEILDFDIDSETTSLIISLDSRTRGELTITLPRNLIDSKTESGDSDFDILVGGLTLYFFDETVSPIDRTITIPFTRSDNEIIVSGTHIFAQTTTALTKPQQIEKTIEEELQSEIPEGKAKLLIFSDTEWSGALQSSSFDYTEVNGKHDTSVIFGCESSLTREGVFGAKIQKTTQDGYLRIVAIQNQEIMSQGSTVSQFGEILINGNCVSDFENNPEVGGCLIATATYGSEMAPQVQQLREIRDNQLMSTESGASFMTGFNPLYYSFSPYIADMERENPVFKEMVKIAITPMLSTLSILNYVDIDSESKVLGYGISLILLNGMMYVGIPIIAIMKLRK